MEIQLSDSQTLRVFVMAGSWFRIQERFLWKTMEGPSTIRQEARSKERMLNAANTTVRNSGAETTAAKEPGCWSLGFARVWRPHPKSSDVLKMMGFLSHRGHSKFKSSQI